MPIYEYQCTCGRTFEQYGTMRDSSAPVPCSCGGLAAKVILHAPRVFGDFEGYISPASGRWVEGRRARTEDLKRTGCRPYEDGEREAFQLRQAQQERELDSQVDEYVERTFNELTA